MKLLCRTTALATMFGALTLGAAAQDSAESKVASGEYCDTMWSNVDADGDGFVSEREAQNDLDLRFSAIDSDGDGDITEVEYIDCQTGKGAPVVAPVDRDEETFRSADVDSDEQLDRQEFAAAAQGSYEDAQSEPSDETYKSFSSYTWLTEEERGATDTTIDQMSADEAGFRASMNFNALDANNDDIIDTSEWAQRDAAPRYDEEWASAQFDRLDGDKSGAITKQEYAEARSTMVDDMTTATVTFEEDVKNADDQTATTSSASDGEGMPVYLYHFSWW